MGCGIAMYNHNHKNHFECCPRQGNEILAKYANVALLIERRSTTTSSDLPEAWKAPHIMRYGPTFSSICNSPLVSHQHSNELGHDHHGGKG